MRPRSPTSVSSIRSHSFITVEILDLARCSAEGTDHGHQRLDHLRRDLDLLRHLVLLRHHALAVRSGLLGGGVNELDAVLLESLSGLELSPDDTLAIGGHGPRPSLRPDLLQIGPQLFPQCLGDQWNVLRAAM